MTKCPQCGNQMQRCNEGHEMGFDIFAGGNKVPENRGKRDPHWTCLDGSHGVVMLFDDGEILDL